MKKSKSLNYKMKTKILKAMAHPTRLVIIEKLASGPLCVCEINKFFDHDQSTISKHLAVLKNAGIIDDEKKGMNVFYSLKAPCILDCFECIEKLCTKEQD